MRRLFLAYLGLALAASAQIIPPNSLSGATPSNIVVVGDSHMAGYQQTASIPSQLNPIPPFSVSNQAISGVKVCAHYGDQGTNEAALNTLFNRSARVNILVMDGDGNAMIDNNSGNPAIPAVSPQVAHDCMKAFALRERAAGWKVVLYPMYSRSQTGYGGQTGDQLHDALNALWDADWFTFADAYVPHDPDTPAVWNTGDNTGACFNSADHIHIVDACTPTLASSLTRAVNQAELGVGLPTGSSSFAGGTIVGATTIAPSSNVVPLLLQSSSAYFGSQLVLRNYNPSDFTTVTFQSASQGYLAGMGNESQSSYPNSFLIYDLTHAAARMKIDPSGNTSFPSGITTVANLAVTGSCSGCGASSSSFNGGVVTNPITVQTAASYVGSEMTLQNQNSNDFSGLNWLGTGLNLLVAVGNSGSAFPDQYIWYDQTHGARRGAIDGSGSWLIDSLKAPASQHYFVCVDGTGKLYSQATACQ